MSEQLKADFAIDPAHFDALYVQSETEGVSTEDKHAYLAGIGACWPEIRARLWQLSTRVAAEQEDGACKVYIVRSSRGIGMIYGVFESREDADQYATGALEVRIEGYDVAPSRATDQHKTVAENVKE